MEGRRGERDRDRERNINVREKHLLVDCLSYGLTWNGTRNPGMCPDWESNPLSFSPGSMGCCSNQLSHTSQDYCLTIFEATSQKSNCQRDIVLKPRRENHSLLFPASGICQQLPCHGDALLQFPSPWSQGYFLSVCLCSCKDTSHCGLRVCPTPA